VTLFSLFRSRLQADHLPSLSARRNGLLFFQFIQQRLSLLQVLGIKPLGEPPIDLGQQLPGLFLFALLLPQSGEACSCTQLPVLRALLPGNVDGFEEAGFGFAVGIWDLG
jgi:hypothetical protein